MNKNAFTGVHHTHESYEWMLAKTATKQYLLLQVCIYLTLCKYIYIYIIVIFSTEYCNDDQ